LPGYKMFEELTALWGEVFRQARFKRAFLLLFVLDTFSG
jgi:hypothetical protein